MAQKPGHFGMVLRPGAGKAQNSAGIEAPQQSIFFSPTDTDTGTDNFHSV